MRTFTKLERRLLDLTPSDASQICALWSQGKRQKVKPYVWHNRGRTLSGTCRGKIANTLKAIGLQDHDMDFGSDAPRGGQEGKWIQLTPSGWQKIKRALHEQNARMAVA